ncbi:MAG: FHA domain-containing protein, partial [Chitinivibrionales bacterium]|nr:FHA domain-containing protein [Chitinivibrionales bacterium]
HSCTSIRFGISGIRYMAYLVFLNDLYQQEKKVFERTCSIGRASTSDVCLQSTQVSRNHARISYNGKFYTIEDLGSKNGVWVNNTQLPSYVAQPLFDGDCIKISTSSMTFYSEGREAPKVKQPARVPALMKEEEKTIVSAVPGLAESAPAAPASAASAPAAPEQSALVAALTALTAPETPIKQVAAVGAEKSRSQVDESAFVVKKDGTEGPMPEQEMAVDVTAVFELEPAERADSSAATAKRLQRMVKVSCDLGALFQADVLIDKILDNIFDIFPHADRSFILIQAPGEQEFKPIAGRRHTKSTSQQTETYEVSQTIINTVLKNKQSVLSSNAQKDERFMHGQSIADFSIRSLMYVPFIYQDEILGIITVDTKSIHNLFDKNDLLMLTGIATLAAVSLKNVQLFKEVKVQTQQRTQLSRYLSPHVVEGVLAGTIPCDFSGQKKNGTILFCDIIGFTSMSESRTAVAVIDALNRYFGLISDIIIRNNGTLHKYEGDMLVAFWNVLIEDKNADMNAVHAAIEMQIAVWKLSLEMETEGRGPIHTGIGCSSGEFAGGNIGGKDKMEYTVIGDVINLGKRIESLSGRWQVFISENTYKSIASVCIAIELPAVTVKGKSRFVTAYSIRGIEIYSNVLLLNIPVVIRDGKGTFTIKGLLVGCCTEASTMTISLYSTHTMQPGATLDVRFFLIELMQELELKGTVDAITSKNSGDAVVYSHITVKDIVASDAVRQFLTPGYCGQSNNSWEEMRRK